MVKKYLRNMNINWWIIFILRGKLRFNSKFFNAAEFQQVFGFISIEVNDLNALRCTNLHEIEYWFLLSYSRTLVLNYPDYKKLWRLNFKMCILTLPVRRYLVPTPSTKGGGDWVDPPSPPPPRDLENCGLYKLQLWQIIRTIYER